MAELERNNESPRPSLGELVEKAGEKFDSRRVYVSDSGRVEAYVGFTAAEEVVMEAGVPAYTLLGTILNQTTVSPEEVDFNGLEGMNNWEEVMRGMATYIIERELAGLRPEVTRESFRRVEEVDG